MLAAIGSGDILVVSRLDRLARSTRDLLNIVEALTQRGASFRSLGEAWADTATLHGRLMLPVLGGLAAFERELVRARTSDGRTLPQRGASLWAALHPSRRTSDRTRPSHPWLSVWLRSARLCYPNDMTSLSQESEALARRLADVQRVSVEDAVRQALEDRARAAGIMPQAQRSRDASPEAIEARMKRFDAFAQKLAATPINDPRSPREIMDDLNAL